MKNFKKFLTINHASGKSFFEGLFITYAVLIFIVILNSIPDITVDNLTYFLRGFFYIFATIALFYIPLFNLNKKLILSLPIDDIKIYPLSILFYQSIILVIFYLPYFVLAIILKGKLFTSLSFWMFHILFLSTILKCSYREDTDDTRDSKSYIALLSIWVFISLFTLSGGPISRFVSEIIRNLETKNIPTSLLLLGALIIVFIFKSLIVINKFNKTKKAIKRKSKEETVFNKDKKFNLLSKLKFWSSIQVGNIMSIVFTIMFYFFLYIYKGDVYINKIFLPILFIPNILVQAYNLPEIYNLTVGMPINIFKLYLKEKLINLIIYTFTALIVFIYFYYNKLIINEGFISVFLSSLLFSILLFSICEFFHRGRIPLLLNIFIFINFINFKYLIIKNTPLLVFLYILVIVIYISTYFSIRNSIMKHGYESLLNLTYN